MVAQGPRGELSATISDLLDIKQVRNAAPSGARLAGRR